MAAIPKVLLVDDEPETVRLVRKILQADGCLVDEAYDGEAAIKAHRTCSPDLILLDLVLPVRDGLDVLREIRKVDRITGIIMVSALSSERMTVDCMLAGADDYIGKPFPIREIRIRIRQVLEKAALRRENSRLQEQLERANGRIRELVQRYLPAQVMAEFMVSPEPPALGGRRQETSIIYADIHGFTPVAAALPPEQLVEILNHYLQLAADAIQAQAGTLDKFMGDGVIGIFNAPFGLEDHAMHAVKAAQAIVAAFRESAYLECPLSICIGINTGDVVVGNIGTPQLMNYTAVGDAANVAQRLQEIAGPGEIVIGQRTHELLAGRLPAEGLGPQSIRGRTEPILAYLVPSECPCAVPAFSGPGAST